MPANQCQLIDGKWCNSRKEALSQGDVIKCGSKIFTIYEENLVYFNSNKHYVETIYRALNNALNALEEEANSNQQGILSNFLNYVSQSFSGGQDK